MREFWIMTGISTVQRLTAEQLHATAPDDVMVISETRGGAIAAWSLDGGLAFAAPEDYTGSDCWVSVVGNPEATPKLVDAALADLGEQVAGVTVPRGVPLALWNAAPPPGHEHDSEWDLMATWTAPPAQAGESRVIPLDDPFEIQAFLDRVSPTHSVRADYELAKLWLGVRGEPADVASSAGSAGSDTSGSPTSVPSGSLLAVGALTRRISGVAYLASIATDPHARGQGLGAAITAQLTRRVFEGGEKLCTLAHYHPNEPARRVYLRVGYRTTHRFSSGHIKR
jgi:ribosomal protein S18 acetylase RimI-like enzyme